MWFHPQGEENIPDSSGFRSQCILNMAILLPVYLRLQLQLTPNEVVVWYTCISTNLGLETSSRIRIDLHQQTCPPRIWPDGNPRARSGHIFPDIVPARQMSPDVVLGTRLGCITPSRVKIVMDLATTSMIPPPELCPLLNAYLATVVPIGQGQIVRDFHFFYL